MALNCRAIRLAPWLSLLLPLLLTSCGDAAAGGAAAPVVRDSAGIQIVENTGSAWTDGAEWRLSDEPILQIGRAEGAAEYLLDRVAGARRLAEGGLVIANGGSGELRYYGSDGTYLRSVGGFGEGPGEFRGMEWVKPYGVDSLAVFDRALERISMMSSEGEFGRVVSLTALGVAGRSNPQGVFGNGVILGDQRVRVETRSGLQQSDAVYELISEVDAAITDTLAIIPGMAFYVTMEPPMVMLTSPLLTPQPYGIVSHDRAYVGYGGAFEIQEFDAQGTLLRLIRKSAAPVPASGPDLDRLLEEQFATIDDAEVKERHTGVLAQLPRPEFHPAFTGLMADDDGNLWVQESRLPWETASWQVFDAEGRLLAPVEMPVGFRPLHIGSDFIVGLVTDDLDIQQVELYELVKSEG